MSVLAQDNFNRANSGSLGANWTTGTALSAPGILSNAFATQGASDHGAFYNAITWPNNQYSQVAAVVNATSFNTDGAPLARMASGAWTAYLWDISNVPQGKLFKVVATAFTGISTATNLTCNAGDTVRLETQGTTIRGLVNGSVISGQSQTDSAISSGSAGVFFSSATATTTAWWDNFEGGDFVTTLPPGLGPDLALSVTQSVLPVLM